MVVVVVAAAASRRRPLQERATAVTPPEVEPSLWSLGALTMLVRVQSFELITALGRFFFTWSWEAQWRSVAQQDGGEQRPIWGLRPTIVMAVCDVLAVHDVRAVMAATALP